MNEWAGTFSQTRAFGSIPSCTDDHRKKVGRGKAKGMKEASSPSALGLEASFIPLALPLPTFLRWSSVQDGIEPKARVCEKVPAHSFIQPLNHSIALCY